VLQGGVGVGFIAGGDLAAGELGEAVQDFSVQEALIARLGSFGALLHLSESHGVERSFIGTQGAGRGKRNEKEEAEESEIRPTTNPTTGPTPSDHSAPPFECDRLPLVF
jgi:hypothetical protein